MVEENSGLWLAPSITGWKAERNFCGKMLKGCPEDRRWDISKHERDSGDFP